MLGAPVVEVELTSEQISIIVDQALNIYGTYKPIEKIGTISVLSGQQKYLLAANVYGRGVINVMCPDLMKQPISLEQFDIFRYYTQMPTMSPGDFYAERLYYKEVLRAAGSDFSWFTEDLNDGTGNLYISPTPDGTYSSVAYIYVIDPTLAEVPPADDDFMMDYVLAMCKQVLGNIRSKYSGIQASEGSIEMDGSTLRQEGAEERKTMEEYLADRGQIIPPIRG